MPTKVPAKSLRIPAFAVGVKVSVTVAALLFVVLSVAACSSTPKSERLSPQTMSTAPPPQMEEEAGPDPRELPAEPEAVERQSPLMVVIEDRPAGQSSKPSLVEAAAAERKRRETAGKSMAVITDKNLHEFSDGQLTEVGGSEPPKTSTQPAAPAASVAAATSASGNAPESDSTGGAAGSTDPETYWRGRVLEARMNWAAAVEEIRHLKSRIAELRQRFYAEEDPYYRDSQIKPSWDRAIDRLEEARAATDEYRLEVRNILEEGRRASALPGWLREGVELEPDILESSREIGPSPPSEYVPGEPKVAADPDGKRR